MAKKVKGVVKLQIPAGAANPAPPVGPALGSAGVNIMQFCKEFNAKTQKQAGLVIPVIITVAQLAKIVEMKKADLNTTDVEAAIRMIAGTARNMGIEVVD